MGEEESRTSGSEDAANAPQNDTPPEAASAEAQTASSSADAARDAAMNLVGDAGKDMDEIKGMGIGGFFSFDRFYFPIFARYLFIVMVGLGILGILVGILVGVVTMFKTGFLAGLFGIIGSIIFGILGIIFYRFLFETMLLGFKIYESLEKVREKI